MPSFSPALALNRFGLGPKPGDLERMASNPRENLLAELANPRGAQSESSLPPSNEIFLAMRRFLVARTAARKTGDAAKLAALGPAPHNVAYRNEVAERVERAQTAVTGFVERLVAFWSNHFAVSNRLNNLTQGLVGSFEREAIRPHVLGKFEGMLLAATRHPAMLFYLNNASSFGPNSPAGLRRDRGLNENHARELLELHTVGVDAGYTQADVTSFARVLTGWTVDQNQDRPETCGRFLFRPAMHEPGSAMVMGVSYPQEGRDQGEAVLMDLAGAPATAHHLAKKIARHFVADEPPAALVESFASTFQDTGGDLRAMATTLVQSDEAWATPTKLKKPQEFVWSALRALSLDADVNVVRRALATLGEPLWGPPSPKGFSDDSAEWLAPDAMTNRLDIANDFASRAAIDTDPLDLAGSVLGAEASGETMAAIAGAESRVQALTLMLMSPEFQRR